MEIDIPRYIAHFASSDDWSKLAKTIFTTFIMHDKSPPEELGISIEKIPNRYRAKSSHKITLPGNKTILDFKDKPIFNKIDFWFCDEGILMTRYIPFCVLIILDYRKNSDKKSDKKFNDITIVRKSLSHATIILTE